MSPREIAARLTQDPEVRGPIARLLRSAELTDEEREGVLRLVLSYVEHIQKLDLLMTGSHLIHAVEAAIGTALEARGEVAR